MTMKLADVTHVLEDIAPTRFAESWDNVGLLVGDPEQDVSAAMLTIDYTPAVAREAADAKCDLIVAYHPPIFDPIKRVNAGSLIYDAIRRGVAIYSPHTALDVADGGTNDMLGDVLGLKDRRPLRFVQPKSSQYKLVTFVPEKDLQRVGGALFEAGAGRIGDYSSCSFRTPGTGTFFGNEGANPAIGKAGRLEEAAEVRLETVMPISRLTEVLDALYRTHPYEEPAFDLVQLAAPPEKLGQGRIGRVDPPVSRADMIEQIKQGLSLNRVLVSGPADGPVRTAACCAGACGNFLDDAICQKADLYLTGEMRHHDAIKAANAGLTVVCALHSNSERPILASLQVRLGERLPGLPVHLSRVDRDPFAIR